MYRIVLDKLVPESSGTHSLQRMTMYVNVILSTLIATAVLVFILNNDIESRTGASIFIAYGISALVLTKQGYIRVARTTLPLLLWIILSGLIWNGLGLHSVTVPALSLVILFAAPLGSRWSVLLYLPLCMLTLALVWYGEQAGYIDSGLPRTSSIVELINLYMSLFF